MAIKKRVCPLKRKFNNLIYRYQCAGNTDMLETMMHDALDADDYRSAKVALRSLLRLNGKTNAEAHYYGEQLLAPLRLKAI